MGKALVIKGADFSQVCIDNIPIGGRQYLTSNNPISIKYGYISYTTKQWVSSGNVQTYFWPVNQGDYLISRGNMVFGLDNVIFYFVTLENNTPIFQKRAGNIIRDKNFTISQAPVTGYVAIIVVDGDYIVDFPETFITSTIDDELRESLQITKENKVHSIAGWLKSDGTWGENAYSYSYPVFEGEQLVVTASPLGSTLVGLYSVNLPKNNQGNIYPVSLLNGKMDDIITGSKRIPIPSGQQQTITIPKDGYVVFEAIDGDLDVFPNVQIII